MMTFLHTLAGLFTFALFCFNGASARNHQVTIIGGDIHLKGELNEGGCSISSESQDMHINMGHYTPRDFGKVGTFATEGIPFTIKLTDCNPELVDHTGILFSGMTDPKEPDVFLVTSSDGGPVGITGNAGYSGLGLMISDVNGEQLIPGRPPASFTRVSGNETELHYLARYRATSRDIYPGSLHSEVWFGISYP
ncbi:fimbrial protein [Erwinia endophytica]|uniref:fimbrial protein n=1 Tax=Erwinia endophytica TaxID=1563158 RepID=UPI00186B5A02|nr:fimbrial protein [Erwinia endophytica]